MNDVCFLQRSRTSPADSAWLRWRLAALVAVSIATTPTTSPAADPAGQRSARPNIVVLLADDLGFSDLGCYGGEIDTPHLDRLAADGLRFTQFYNAGRCCPTRAALLTGLHPHQAGVGDMEDDLGAAGYRGFLNDRCLTIAEALRSAGYRSGMAGKWNVGYRPGQRPLDRGFAHYFGLLRGASDYFDPRVGPRAKISLFARDAAIVTDFPADFYATDAFTDAAIAQLDELAAAGPFFLYVAYTAPHSPLQARPEGIAKYRGRFRAGWQVLGERRRARMIELGLLADAGLPQAADSTTPDSMVPEWPESAAERDALDLKMAVYAAQVETMDRGVGRLVAALRDKQLLDDTLILFLSDNGADGHPEPATALPPGPKGSSHIYGRGWAHLGNTPLRGYKRELWEGGIATPLIAHWPKGLRQHGVTHEVGHVVDLWPTCVELAGLDPAQVAAGNKTLPTAGRSLVPIFRTGKREPHPTLFWEHEGHRAVRRGDLKLVAPRDAAWQLFDMITDRAEAHDRAPQHPSIVAELSQLHADWSQQVGVVPWNELRKQTAPKP
jgi:arylsulfatase A-like enzyme